MLLSRGLGVVRAARLLNRAKLQNLQNVKNSHDWNYRTNGPPAPKNVLLAAEIVAATAWWWVLWHLWTEPGHVLGEFGDYPDPSKWTDEELGIPPID